MNFTINPGIPDQYADGKAAKLWEVYIGEKNDRTKHYKEFLTGKLRELGIHHVLDVACGTGLVVCNSTSNI